MGRKKGKKRTKHGGFFFFFNNGVFHEMQGQECMCVCVCVEGVTLKHGVSHCS